MSFSAYDQMTTPDFWGEGAYEELPTPPGNIAILLGTLSILPQVDHVFEVMSEQGKPIRRELIGVGSTLPALPSEHAGLLRIIIDGRRVYNPKANTGSSDPDVATNKDGRYLSAEQFDERVAIMLADRWYKGSAAKATFEVEDTRYAIGRAVAYVRGARGGSFLLGCLAAAMQEDNTDPEAMNVSLPRVVVGDTYCAAYRDPSKIFKISAAELLTPIGDGSKSPSSTGWQYAREALASGRRLFPQPHRA